jgi:hypothetical protein
MKIQPIRLRRDIKDYHIQEEIELIKKISKTEKMSISEVLETINMLEYRRRTDIMIDNFDTFDENISGIDESIKEIAYSINEKNIIT